MIEMHEKVKTTKLVGGRSFSETFFSDLMTLRNFPLKRQLELVDRTLEWIPKKEIEAEWEEWTKDLSSDEKKKLEGVFRILIFIIQEGIKKKFKYEDLINDLRVFGLSDEFINYFVKKFYEEKEKLVKKIAEQRIMVLPEITDVNWAINKGVSTSFGNIVDEYKINLVVEYQEKDKLDSIVFEINKEELYSLIETLQLIYEEVVRCQ